MRKFYIRRRIYCQRTRKSFNFCVQYQMILDYRVIFVLKTREERKCCLEFRVAYASDADWKAIRHECHHYPPAGECWRGWCCNSVTFNVTSSWLPQSNDKMPAANNENRFHNSMGQTNKFCQHSHLFTNIVRKGISTNFHL